MHSLFGRYARNSLSALLCAAAVCSAGCHRNNQTSGYGIVWVTLSAEPGDFASYIVNVDSVVLTGKKVGSVTALATVERVDFTKLNDISELWGSANLPNDTYTKAVITLDYATAVINVLVNGVPQKATVLDSAGTTPTTVALTVNLDPANVLTIDPTYASTSAKRLAITFNLAASNQVNLATNPATVTVEPFMTATISAPDNKPIRVRGPLINSSVSFGTYTVYVRPFYDEVDSLGALAIFNNANTVYTISGTTYVGTAGLTALAQSSAGSTITAAYTTFEPTLTPSTTAGIFHSSYVIAGSTLEDVYTQGIEGDVIARSGNTLTVRGATLIQNTANTTSYVSTPDAMVMVGPNTIVTADGNPGLKNLTYQSVSVGQHISARGIYSLPSSGVTTVDATGNSSTNTGSVRIQSSQLYGSTVSAGAGSVALNLLSINGWPSNVFNFAGAGASTAQDPSAANYLVNTGTIAVPAGTIAGTPLWIDGNASPFGSAPPAFNAVAVSGESSVRASLRVHWTGAGTTVPFAALTATGMTIDLANASFSSGVIRVGTESIDLKSLAASPQIVPCGLSSCAPGVPTSYPTTTGLPAVYAPAFAVGNPVSSAAVTAGGSTSTATTAINAYQSFAPFVAQLTSGVITTTNPVVSFEAGGLYNRATNTFTASSISVVL